MGRPRFSPLSHRQCTATQVAAIGLLVFILAPAARAQLNWEGQTGALLTPFAYTPDSSSRGFGRPELSFHYMNVGPALGNEFQASTTVGFLKIGEIGYTRSFNAQGSSPSLGPLFTNGFNIYNIKIKLIPENVHGAKFMPAFAAAAAIRKQVRRITEATEREDTTCADFDLIATKTINELRALPILLNFGVKLTNASLMGLAADSPDWVFRTFGAAAFELKGPQRSKLLLGMEFLQQPPHFKEVPGPVFTTSATVPTTLSYFVRVRPGGDAPFNLDFGVVQLGGNLGTAWNIQARHQFTMGVSYRF
jgi:hypothetical protein